MANNYLIIFIRYPEPGKVKTRLGKSIGGDNASELYRIFVEALLNRICFYAPDKCNYKVALFFTPDSRRDAIKDWLGKGPFYYPQMGNNLGERMSNAFNTISDMGAKKAIIIGSDTPTLEKRSIMQAFELLNNKDAVIGPTKDGGYYLLGFSFVSNPFKKIRDSKIFSDIEWSTEKVFAQTMAKVKQSGFTFKALPEHYDIDIVEDLNQLKQDITQTKNPREEHLLKIYHRLESLDI